MMAQPKEHLRLIHADVLENITEDDGKSVQILTGNIKFQKKDVILTSQRGYYWQRDDIGSFVDSVLMVRNEQVLTLDSLVFDSKNDILTGFSNIHFTDGEYDLISDTLIYFLNADSGIASGNVHFMQGKQTITSQTLTYQKKEGDRAANYTATGDVNISEENRKATCGKSQYDFHSETLILLEDPIMFQDKQTMSGEEIHLFYRNDTLHHVTIPDKAHIIHHTEGKVETAIQEEDSTVIVTMVQEFVNDMTGRELKAFFIDGVLDSVRLEGMATNLYHLFEDSIYQGNNIASGDTITLFFKTDSSTNKNDLDFIHIVGGARGEYHPSETMEDINAPIYYRADTIEYTIPDQITALSKSAQIEYQDTKLTSGFIKVTWENNLLNAVPKTDSLGVVDGNTFPIFLEKGKNPLVGNSLIYNLSTGRGRVNHGKTEMQDGYYSGDEIRNRGADVFLVRKGVYTTCDLDTNPHFHFGSNKMKMITDELIVTRPLVLHLGGIPVFALPFAVFPDQSGKRHSGWIMPSYGETSLHGQYLKGLGYFWAPNNYWDSKFLLDFYDQHGIVFTNHNRYKKRYGFNGNINLKYNRTIPSRNIVDLFEKPESIQWSVAWKHHQKLRKNQSLNVNASYYSDNDFNRQLGINRSTRLNQKAVSRASYSKSWPEWKWSISANLSQTRNLMTRNKIDPVSFYYEPPNNAESKLTETTEAFPTLSFRRGQSELIKSPESEKARRWFHNIYWSYSSTLRNMGTGFYETDSLRDSLDVLIPDTLIWGNRQHEFKSNWVHSINLSSPQKIFKYITVSPRFSYKEEWISRYFDADSADINGNPINKKEIKGFLSRRTGTLSLNSKTKIYGLFHIHVGPLRAVRHTLTPSIGFSFQPDYSKPLFGYDFGYFKTLKDSQENEHLFDPYSGTSIGSTSRREKRSMNLSVNNVFQAKVVRDEKEKKINFLSWNMRTGYNFTAQEFNLSKLRSSIRATLPPKLSLDISLTHDFYRLNNENNRINEFNTNKRGVPIPRLEQVSAATGFRLSGKRFSPPKESLESLSSKTAKTDTTYQDTILSEDIIAPTTGVTKMESPQSAGKKLWDARISIRYSVNRSNPSNIRKTFWMNTGLNIHITQKWRVQYSTRFDLMEKKLVSHDFNIYRDLHCWELNFTWTPSGMGRGFYLRINVKSPSLQDLKVESKGGRWSMPGI